MNGSKIDNLETLKRAGIHVPNFQILSFQDVFPDGGLTHFIEENKDISLEQLRKFVLEYMDTHMVLKENWNLLKGELFAVRSSSNVEDGKQNSFAGQFDTYLNVSKSDLKENIKKCFHSMVNRNVLEYMKNRKLDIADLRMNVIIQEMVASEYSGILFTANPQGILNESVIVVGKGLGENVVSDKVNTTTYFYHLDDKLYYYEGEKEYLDRKMVEKLITLSQKITSIIGPYLDIEYGIINQEIYILQVRSITTLSLENILVMDNSNIVESYPGICLPFTISFVKSVYSGIFKQLCTRILKNKKDLKKLDDVFLNMVSSANGRLYYKISNWYSLLVLLPFSGKIIPIWQEMLGVKNKSVSTTVIEYNFFKKTKIAFRFLFELLHSQKNMERLNQKFMSIQTHFQDSFQDDIAREEIIELYEKIRREVLSIWDITLVNDMYAFLFTGLLKKRLKKKYKNYETITNQYIAGITNIESVKPIQALMNLVLEKDNLSELEFQKRCREYIQLYGDRNLEELKIESLTYRSNPELLEEKIEEYAKDTDNLRKLSKKLSSTKLGNKKENWLTRFLLKKVKKGITNREISRLNRSRIYGMVRSMILKLGSIYQQEGIIKEQRDIFYLTLEEIFSKDYASLDYQILISDRKMKYRMYEDLPNYSRLLFAEKEFDKNHTKINKKHYQFSEKELRGIPCSSGIVEGQALVVKNVNKVKDVKEKILVTKMTDPGWVFLLATAKGVISEKGSLLSHTAIISRELGIPSVVNVENALNCIETGDWLEMDGNTGIIKIIKKGDENGDNKISK